MTIKELAAIVDQRARENAAAYAALRAALNAVELQVQALMQERRAK